MSRFKIEYIDTFGKYSVCKALGPWPLDNWSQPVYLASTHAECARWVEKVIAESMPEFLAAKEREYELERKARIAKLEERDRLAAQGVFYDAVTDQMYTHNYAEAS